MFTTYLFRFRNGADPVAPAILYLLKNDFTTPQDCLREDDPFWVNEGTRRTTWGKTISTPFDVELSEREYTKYSELAKVCVNKFMSTIIREKAQRLLES